MKPTIVLTGGGSGGHITPLLAVATELKHQQPGCHLVYIGQTGDRLGDIPSQHPAIDEVFSVRAGKFRRYHGEGFKQLLNVKTGLLNIRDMFLVLIGLWQSWRLLKRLAPAVIFIKGGFVGVPVGLAAARLRIPFITHDSDAVPGLANRIIARWASHHAVALPVEVYSYPAGSTISTGIPIQADFQLVNKQQQAEYRRAISIPESAKLLFVIGGGLGSQRINRAVADIVPHLLYEFPDLYVVHGVGRANEAVMQQIYASTLSVAAQARLKVFGYAEDVYRYSGAADIIITRAGATNLAEFAAQGKACIVVPSPFLTGGHQLKNARYLAEQGAALVIDEPAVMADVNRLAKPVSQLLRNPKQRQDLGRALAAFARPTAAADLAALILHDANKR